MADEKIPAPAPADDLKARLRLSSKSLRQQQQEEEERRKAEEEARKKAEAEKVRREKERQEQFSLAGAAPAKTEWSSHWEVPSEEELKKLEALPESGKHGKRVVVAILVGIALVAMAAFGYYFGRAFFGRSLENAKIDEARAILEWKASRAEFFDAVEKHKAAINELVTDLEKQNVTPEFKLEKLQAFIDASLDFLERHKPFTAREVFGSDIRNPEVANEVISYVDALNRMFMMTEQMTRESGILAVARQEKPANLMATIAFESDPQGEGEQKLPWNRADVVLITPESRQQLTPIPVENPDGTTQPGATHFTLPVKKLPGGEVVDVDTAQIAEFDAWPLIANQHAGYRQAMLERAVTTALDLKAIADKVSWPRVEKQVKEVADKEHYFTL